MNRTLSVSREHKTWSGVMWGWINHSDATLILMLSSGCKYPACVMTEKISHRSSWNRLVLLLPLHHWQRTEKKFEYRSRTFKLFKNWTQSFLRVAPLWWGTDYTRQHAATHRHHPVLHVWFKSTRHFSGSTFLPVESHDTIPSDVFNTI